VVIQTTPHAEPAHASQGLAVGVLGAESQQDNSGAEQNGLSVFAKILAGLQEKTVTATHTATETYDSVGAVEQIELGRLQDGNERGFPQMSALAASLTETVRVEQNLMHEGAKPQAGHSQQDKNTLNNLAAFDTGLSADQLEELTALTSENGEAYLLAGAGQTANPGAAANSPGANQEAIYSQLREFPTETAQGGPAAEQAAVRAGELTEKPRNANVSENARTGTVAAEIAATKEDAGESFSKQVDAGKTLADANAAGEPRVRDQRRGYASDVRDFRVGAQTETAYSGANAGETRAFVEGAGREMVLELRMPTQNGNSSATTAWESRPSQVLENMLARELHQHVNNDIVRQASIMLREGSEGVIRLALKPETLGNVKIHLEMAENKITGYIVVESEEALRAFERELASLEKEFRDAGYEGAELKMALADKGGDQQWHETEDGRFLGRLVASRYEDAGETTEATLGIGLYGPGTGAVDVLA